MTLAIDHPERVDSLVVMGPGGIEARETYFKMPGIQKMVSQFVGSGFDRRGCGGCWGCWRTTRDYHRRAGGAALQHPADPAEGVLATHVDPDLTPDSASSAARCSASGESRTGSVPHRRREDPACGPDSRFIMYSRCGHWAMIERAEVQPLCHRVPPGLSAAGRRALDRAARPSELYQALTHRHTVTPLRVREPELTIDDAYAISLGDSARGAARGRTVIGKKIGVTSRAVQDMRGVHQPDFGLADRPHAGPASGCDRPSDDS